MNTKELLIKEILDIPDTEPILEEMLALLESKKKKSGLLSVWDGKTTWHGRPIIKAEDLKNIECHFPPEPDWA